MTTTEGTGAAPPTSGGGTAHIWRVGIVLAIVIAAALAARALVYPASFGKYGYFRGDALHELMENPEPLHQGREVCGQCHDDELEIHAKDVHGNVECETCHGPGRDHVQVQSGDADGEGAILVPRSKEACLTCHRRLAARPASFPQIDPDEHYALLRITDATTACQECHNPHEPLFLEQPADQARLHPMLNECVDCHKHTQDPTLARPEDHPIIFECTYCHSEVATDFAERPHASLRCGICHQFTPISERGGRILKHRGVRFCLLCHQERSFRGEGAPPSIGWPAHLEDMGGDPDDTETVCADCHREAFHLEPSELGGK